MKRFSNKLELDGFKERIPSFTTGIPGIILTVCSMLLNLLNMYTDIALAFFYFSKCDYWFGSWTLGFVVVPSFFISLYTFILHKKSGGKFLMKVSVPKPVVYSLCLMLHGHIARCIMWLTLLMKRVPLLGVRKALWAFRDITSYAETFTHSLPQLCLQLYVMVIYNGTYTELQVICFVSSWLSAAWGIQSQFDGIKWKLVAFEVNLFWFASRAAAVDMLASFYKPASFIMMFLHFLLMFPLWFVQNKFTPFRRKQGTNRFDLIVTDAFYAAIYAGSNTATPITCKYQLPLAIILCVENCICIFLGYHRGTVTRKITHFDMHKENYSIKNITQFGTESCTDFQGSNTNSLCNVPFETWQKSNLTFRLAITVTVIGFLQVMVIVILRWRKVIANDAMVSKLGSTDFRKKADGRVTSSNSTVPRFTKSSENSPVTSPVSSPPWQNSEERRLTLPSTTNQAITSTETIDKNKEKVGLGIENNAIHLNNNVRGHVKPYVVKDKSPPLAVSQGSM